MNKFIHWYVVGISMFSLSSFAAGPSHKGISFQGVIKLPNGDYPSVAGVTVRGLVLSSNNCILREEEFSSVNIVKGYINLVIGQGVADGDDPGLTMAEVMDNTKVRNGLKCIDSGGVRVNGSFNPSSSSGVRKFRIDLAVNGIPVLADFNMRAMAYAVNSETLNGKADNDFLQVDLSKGVTQVNLEKVLAQTTKLENLLSHANPDGTVNAATALTAVTAQGLDASYTVPVAQGGTGATTASGALQNLLPSQAGKVNYYLQTDGTAASWQPVITSGGTITEVVAGSGLTGGATAGTATLGLEELNTQGTYTKITTDKYGRVTTGTTLADSDIPVLPATKITSGTLTVDVQSTNVSATNLAGSNLKLWNGTDYLTFTYPAGGAGYSLEWPAMTNAANANMVLQTDGAGKLQWVALPSVLAYTAGTGLDLTGTTFSVKYGTGAGEAVQGNDSRLTGAFQSSTSLGQDLSGTLPNPKVVKINEVPVAKALATDDQKFLKYVDGTGWVPHYVKLSELKDSLGTGSAFNVASCTASQTMGWSSITDKFECQDIQLSLAGTAVTGTLPVTKGGTGLNAAGTANQLLGMNAAGSALEYKTMPTCGANQYVTFDGTSFSCVNDAGASGTVASIASGTPALTFSSSTGTITANISDASTSAKGLVQLAASGGTTAGTVVQATDARLSDSRAPSGAAGGDLTGTYPNPTLKATGTAGTYTKVTTDAQGRVTSGTALADADITTALGYTPVSKAGDSLAGNLTFDNTKGSEYKGTTANTATLTGPNAAIGTSYVLRLPTSQGTANQVMSVDGSGNLGWTTLSSLAASGTVNNSNWSGAPLSIANGGTGATTQAGAANAVLPPQGTHAGKYLVTNGTDVSWAVVPTVTYGTTAGTALQGNQTFAGDVTGTVGGMKVEKINEVPVAKALATDDQKFLKYVDGTGWVPQHVKLSELKDSLGTGSAFNVVGCTASQTMGWSSITDKFQCQDIQLSLAGTGVTGTLPVTKGGTGLSAAGTANQLLGMNAAGSALEYKSMPTCGANQYITFNGTSFTCANDAGASGTVASISSGTAALTFSSSTGTITANISDATTAAKGLVQLAANGGTTAGTVVQATDARLSDSRAPSGAAGGDLTGTYPNPTLKATGTAGTYTKVTTDAQGRVISGTTLAATDIPNLDWAKITSGKPTTLAGYGITDSLVSNGGGVGKISSGLDASKPGSPATGDLFVATDSKKVYRYTGAVWDMISSATGTGGTVTTMSVVSANGFAGSVATATTTPAITLSTTVTGLVKGNGTAFSAAGSADVTGALGFTPVNRAGDTVTGNLTFDNTKGTSYKGTTANTATLTGPNAAIGTSYVLRLPATQGAANQVMSVDGSGNLGWTTLSSLATSGTVNNSNWSGAPLSIANGGTGATTQAGAQTALGIGTAGTKNTGTISGTVPLIGGTGITANSMCTSDGTSALVCNSPIPTGSQWTTSGSNIYYNTGNVGIGKATPSAKLEVAGGLRVADGTAAAPSLSFSNKTDTGLFLRQTEEVAVAAGGSPVATFTPWNTYFYSPVYLPNGAANDLAIGSSSGAGLYFPGVNTLAITTNSAERLRVDSLGNVGIGNNNPTTKLDVTGTVKATAFQGDGSGLTGVSAAPAGADNQIQFNNSGVMAGASKLLWNNTAAGLTVGSGMDNSSFYPLYIARNTGNAVVAIANEGTDMAGKTAEIEFRLGGNDRGGIKMQTINTSTSAYDMTFWTKETGFNLERMRIANNGNVGIGTTTPASKLQVAGTISNVINSVTSTFTCGSTALDMSTSNFIRLSPSNLIAAGACGVGLTNLKPGASYTIVVTGNAATNAVTYNFLNYTFKYLPGNGPTTAGKDTIYTLLYDGVTVYVTWATGY